MKKKTKKDPLKPANMTIRTAEKALKKALPRIQKEVARLEKAKRVSDEALNFRFTV